MTSISEDMVFAFVDRLISATVRRSPAIAVHLGQPLSTAWAFVVRYPQSLAGVVASYTMDIGTFELTMPSAWAEYVFFGGAHVALFDIAKLDDFAVIPSVGEVYALSLPRAAAYSATIGIVPVCDDSSFQVGELVLGRQSLFTHPVGAAISIACASEVIVGFEPSPRAKDIALDEVVALPDGVGIASRLGDTSVLSAAADHGYVLRSSVEEMSVLPRTAPAARYPAPSVARQRLFMRAMAQFGAFAQFLGFYQVLEHAFLEGHVNTVAALLRAEKFLDAHALWRTTDSELLNLQRVIEDLFRRGKLLLPNASSPYPPAGSAVYVQLGFNQAFRIDAANYRKQIASVIYKARCGVVHTKSQYPYLVPDVDVTALFVNNLVPDIMLIARAMLD